MDICFATCVIDSISDQVILSEEVHIALGMVYSNTVTFGTGTSSNMFENVSLSDLLVA